jgi:hypothetical protein
MLVFFARHSSASWNPVLGLTFYVEGKASTRLRRAGYFLALPQKVTKKV